MKYLIVFLYIYIPFISIIIYYLIKSVRDNNETIRGILLTIGGGVAMLLVTLMLNN